MTTPVNDRQLLEARVLAWLVQHPGVLTADELRALAGEFSRPTFRELARVLEGAGARGNTPPARVIARLAREVAGGEADPEWQTLVTEQAEQPIGRHEGAAMLDRLTALNLAEEFELLAQRLRAAGTPAAVAGELARRAPQWAALDAPERHALLTSALEHIQSAFEIMRAPGLPHGIEALGRAGCADLPHGLTLVAGAPALVAAFGVHLLDLHAGNPGMLYCTAERRAEDLWFSLLAHRANLDLRALVTEPMTAMWQQITYAATELHDYLPWSEELERPDDFESLLRRSFQHGIGGRFAVHGQGRACRGIILDLAKIEFTAGVVEPGAFENYMAMWSRLARDLALPIVVLGRLPGMQGAALPDVVPPAQTRYLSAILHLDFEGWPYATDAVITAVKHPACRYLTVQVAFDPQTLRFGKPTEEN